MQTIAVFWFRRDLRLDDNAGLYHALKFGEAVLPIFIFDADILSELEDKADRRVDFIHQAITALSEELAAKGSTLMVLQGKPLDCFRELTGKYKVSSVFTNHDYEPYAQQRDKEIADYLRTGGIAFHSFKDQVVFEKDEVMKDNGEPYTVFTPYSRKWKGKGKLNNFYLKPYPVEQYIKGLIQTRKTAVPSLKELGFEKTDMVFHKPELDTRIASQYDKTRDLPYLEDGTTRLGIHLRFGTISIRRLAAQASKLNETFLNELIWREFFQMILWHMPHTVTEACKKEYDHIKWRYNEQEFEAWCNGQTGYPLVDAGMRELNTTGFMHNRVRMVTASFLVKHLLIDWRLGEAYFAKKLLDYDLASNIGNWQWVAGSGCDAAPYFRIFNPTAQAKKFDPDGIYIRKWVPEIDSFKYPKPMVVHEAARDRCLKAYKTAVSQKGM